MKTDAEVQIMLRERRKGKTQTQAAARAGMHANTARKYEQRGALPSQLKQPRTYRTRPDPFVDDWPWVQAHLERDSAVQAHTLFTLLCDQHPDRYQPGQLRTLQRASRSGARNTDLAARSCSPRSITLASAPSRTLHI